jgi:hypothetical protein
MKPTTTKPIASYRSKRRFAGFLSRAITTNIPPLRSEAPSAGRAGLPAFEGRDHHSIVKLSLLSRE